MKSAEELKNKFLANQKAFITQALSQLGETLEDYEINNDPYSYNEALGSLYAIEDILKREPNHDDAPALKELAGLIRKTIKV